TRFSRDWSSDVCSSDLVTATGTGLPSRSVGTALVQLESRSLCAAAGVAERASVARMAEIRFMLPPIMEKGFGLDARPDVFDVGGESCAPKTETRVRMQRAFGVCQAIKTTGRREAARRKEVRLAPDFRPAGRVSGRRSGCGPGARRAC